MTSSIMSLPDRIIPASLRCDAEVYRRAKRAAIFDIAFLIWSLLFAILYATLASPRCGLMVLVAVVFIVGSLAALRRGMSPAICGNLLCLGGWASLSALAVVSGGSTAPALFWCTCGPFVAILTAGVPWGVFWSLMSFGTMVSLLILEALGVQFPLDVPPENAKALYFAVLLGLVLCHFVLASVRVGVEQRAGAALREANRRLAQARRTLETLEEGFDFSVDEWKKLKREKTALERALSHKLAGVRLHREPETDDDPAPDGSGDLRRASFGV
jgi:hypothetical protein